MIGCWCLVVGVWLLVIGCRLSVVGSFVWKTIPNVARVTRDAVSGFKKQRRVAVWKTVPPPVENEE